METDNMMNRRDFLLKTAQAGGAALAASLAGPVFGATRERLRLGMIGTGMRGQVLLHELLRRDDVEVAALCDIEPVMLGQALAQVEKAGKPRPRT
jgi:hypothetical protein